jgi:hypothetical protein
MPYYDVAKLGTVTQTNIIDEMLCGYKTLRTTGVGIWHQLSHRACAEVSAALEVPCRPTQRSQQHQNWTILMVNLVTSWMHLPYYRCFLGAHDNSLAESESTLQQSRGGWEHLEVLRSSGKGYRCVWAVCIWLLDQITFCWCVKWFGSHNWTTQQLRTVTLILPDAL